MSYESKIYVVEKNDSEIMFEDGFCWANVICSFDLCKMNPSFSSLFQKESQSFIYGEDDNTHITEDRYGELLKEAELKEVIAYLEEEIRHEDYRRLSPCLNMLKGFDEKQWRNLKVLHFGY